MALMLALSTAMFIGCATHNPNYNPQLPPGPTNEPYSVDPRLLTMSNTVAQIQAATAPINPYAGVTDLAVKVGIGAIFGISGIVAGFKNRQAVVNTMAAGVVKAGAAQAVLDHASVVSDSHYTAIASAINDNTGANQTPTGATKS